MIISQRKKFVFIHVQRTGGTTLGNLLRQSVSGLDLNEHYHSNAKSHPISFFDDFKEHYIFGFTRNPWARLFSWYWLKHRNEPLPLAEEKDRFEQYLLNDTPIETDASFFHYNTLDYFTNNDNVLIANHIYKFEDYTQEVKLLYHQLNIHRRPIPVLNANPLTDYRTYYTAASQQLIAEKCERDITHFKYQF